MSRKRQPSKAAVIELPPEDYEPTKEELEEDLSIDTRGMSLRKIFRALLQPVEIRRVSVEKWHKDNPSPSH